MGSDHNTEFAGYLTAKCIKEFSELKMSRVFLSQEDNCSKSADRFCDDKWLTVVCNLLSVFKKINTLNVALQGKGDT